MALVAPVGWLMFLSSKTACVRHVVWLSKSCSQRMPPMLRVSWRPKPASSAVCGTVGAEKPLAKSATVAQPGAAPYPIQNDSDLAQGLAGHSAVG